MSFGSAFHATLVFKGRNGLGNVFVWASGNGGRKGDSCAADGYVSSIYTLAVSSVTEHNTHPWYLEKCAAILVSTYSSGGPGASGIVSLLLHYRSQFLFFVILFVCFGVGNSSSYFDQGRYYPRNVYICKKVS